MIMLRPFLKYADFSGRARRTEYWLFQLFQGMVYALVIAMMIAGAASAKNGIGALAGGALALGFIGLFALGCFLPNLAVMVRRLHDSGKSAWFLLLYAPAMLNGALSVHTTSAVMSGRYEAAAASMQHGTLLTLIGMLCNIAMFVLMVLPGTRGANRFGPDPKGDGTEIARVFDAPDPEPEPVAREPHTPVFDFGPSRNAPAVREAAPQPRYTPASQSGASSASARPTFGKRR